MMNPMLNQHDAKVFLNFLLNSALETFDELGYSADVKDQFVDTFRKKIKLEAERIQNGN